MPETRQRLTVTRFRWLPWLPIGAYLVAVPLALYLDPPTAFNPPGLFVLLNLVFRFGVGIAVAVMAARAYLGTGALPALALGTGMLVLGVGATFATHLSGLIGSTAGVAMHAIAVVAAGAALLAASNVTIFTTSRQLPGSRGQQVAVAYITALAALGLVVVGILAGWPPVHFFVPGEGLTAPARLLYVVATLEFALAGVFFWQAFVFTHLSFFRWYAAGLQVFAVGLAVLFGQGNYGDLVTWMGRLGQFLGGAYILVAVAESGRASRPGSAGRDLAMSLLQSAVPLRPLVESTSEAVIALDADHRVLYWNAAARRLFGYTASDVVGRDLLQLIVRDEHQPAVQAALAAARGTVELRLTCREERNFPAEVSIYRNPAARGAVTVCAIRDISERKQAEAALRDAKEDLEARVADRTRVLAITNARLAEELEERRRAETALRDSEERYRALAAATFEGVAITEDGRYLDANDQWLRVIGYSREELIGREIAADIAAEDRERVLANVRKGCDSHIEHAVIRKDGTRVIVEARGTSLTYRNRTVRFTAIRDVTEARQREEALRRSERRLRTFFESDMVGAIVWNTDGAITDANDKFLQMVGYGREEVLAGRMTWAQMTPPEYRVRDEQALAELRATGVDTPYEKEYIRKDGTRVPVIIGAAMLDERRYEGIAFVLDITERKRVEEERRSLALFPEQNPYPVLRIAEDGTLLYANASSVPLLRQWRRRVGERLEEAQRSEILGARPPGTGELLVRCEERIYSLVALPFPEAGYVNVYGRDVTERERTLAQLQEALAHERQAVADNVALLREVHHRVKNNLQMLCDMMFLQMEAMPDGEQHQDLQDAYTRIYAIARLHEHLHQSMRSGLVLLRDYFGQLARGFDALYPGTAVRIEVQPEPIYLDMDRAIHVGLIANELITNAAKHAFSRSGYGEVVVRLRSVGDTVELRVRDNGQGLPEGLDPGQAKSLGLRIVHILAQRLRATVHVENDPGATFTLTFPLHGDRPVEPR